jgi:S1-C subfamily serine protease
MSAALAVTFVAGVYLGSKIDFSWKVQSYKLKELNPPSSVIAVKTQPQQTNLVSEKTKAIDKTSYALGQETIADIAAQAAPSVVNIELCHRPSQITASSPSISTPFPFGDGKGNDHEGQENHPNPVSPPGPSPRNFNALSSGSGLIIRSNGYIVTNSHLINPTSEIKVTLSDQRAFKAKLVGKDMFADLAVLKIEAQDLPVMPFANETTKSVRPGDWAIAIGNPLGYDHTVTLGIVSAIHRSLKDLNAHIELIQTDAAINPGNSGGPLLNIRGEIIGLNSAIRNDAQNIGFAIPVSIVEQVSTSLIKDGSIARPYLGIFMKDFDNRIISNPRYPANSKGIVARAVVPNGPAQQAGICPRDLIEQFDGVPVSAAQEIRNLAQKHKPGETIELTIIHEGKSLVKHLKIGSYPEDISINGALDRE